MEAHELADLERVSAEFLKAMAEAQELARSGETGEPLREVVRYCADLLDIARDYLDRPDGVDGADVVLAEMDGRLARLRGLVG